MVFGVKIGSTTNMIDEETLNEKFIVNLSFYDAINYCMKGHRMIRKIWLDSWADPFLIFNLKDELVGIQIGQRLGRPIFTKEDLKATDWIIEKDIFIHNSLYKKIFNNDS